jgi:hypothetical protein
MGAAAPPRTLPAPLRCIEGVYRRYSKTGATLAGISVRANLGDQDPFRDPQRITARAWPAQITIICMAARLHRLDPQPPIAAAVSVSTKAKADHAT